MGFRVPAWGSQSITVQFFTSDVLGDCGPTAFRSLTSSSSVVLGWSTTFITISWCTELETEGDEGHLIFLLLSALCRSTVFSLTSFDSSLDLLDRCAVYTFMVVIDQSLIRQSVGVRILAVFFSNTYFTKRLRFGWVLGYFPHFISYCWSIKCI